MKEVRHKPSGKRTPGKPGIKLQGKRPSGKYRHKTSGKRTPGKVK